MSLLQVIVPLLVTEDEKTLVACINCLTKVRFLNFTVYLWFSEIVNTKSHIDISSGLTETVSLVLVYSLWVGSRKRN